MKRVLIRLSAVLLSAVFLLSACAKVPPVSTEEDDPPLTREERTEERSAESTGGKTGEASSVPSAADLPDLASIMSGNGGTGTVWGMLDPAARQELIESAKADGLEVSFGDDGSMTVRDADGTVVVQHPDGTWTVQGEGGQSAQLGGDWPDNEFTRLVPAPGFKLMGASVSDGEFSAAFQSVDVDQVRAYAEKVKAGGFTVDAEEEDQNVYGIVVYTYSAYNADGYRVEISFASGTCGITIGR